MTEIDRNWVIKALKEFIEATDRIPYEKAAEPRKHRLRRMKADGSGTYKSMQRGAMRLPEGIYAGIQNPLTHEESHETDKQIALEYLAALSVLARWVDKSTVETA